MFGRRFEYTDDRQLVTALLSNDEGAIRCVFHDRYRSLLRFNAMKAAPQVPFDDLVQDLYLYLSADNWARLRRYDAARFPFASWFSVVSYRFFKDSARGMIDSAPRVPIDNVREHGLALSSASVVDTLLMDLKNILRRFKPPRDREVLEAFLLRDEAPETIADRFGVTVDNLYNIKRRALERLRKDYLTDYRR